MQEIELQRLLLENKKLEAEILDKRARAAENEIDARLKTAKAAVEEAKGRKLLSEADLKDLEFLDKNEGFSRMEDAEEKERDRQHQREMAMFQARNNDKNIGMV